MSFFDSTNIYAGTSLVNDKRRSGEFSVCLWLTMTLDTTQSLTSSASLQCVETLLRAGLGCIAYLRQASSTFYDTYADVSNGFRYSGVCYPLRTFQSVCMMSLPQVTTVIQCRFIDHLSAELKNAFSMETNGSSSMNSHARRTISGVTIMNLKRGFTNEGDKILDYLVCSPAENAHIRVHICVIYLFRSMEFLTQSRSNTFADSFSQYTWCC